MSNNFNTPAEVVELTINTGISKAASPALKTFLLGILAGAFIALGAAASSMVMHDVSNVSIARMLAGCVFPMGLILIVVVGGELFTGNCLMVEAFCARKITMLSWLRNLGIVYVGNFVGSIIIVGIVIATNQLNYSDATLGALTIKIAMGKTSLVPGVAFASSILCNVLVCAAVLGATAARDIAGKVIAVFFPIMAFVLCGYEHSIANMYFIPAGISAAANPAYVEKAVELYGYTAEKIAMMDVGSFFSNIIPVTLGNTVGGVAIGLIMYAVYKSKLLNKAQ